MMLAMAVNGRRLAGAAAPNHNSVRMRLPKWVWGTDPAGFITAARLHSRPTADGFQVRTEESYLGRRRPELVDDAVVLDSHLRPGGGFTGLASLTHCLLYTSDA